MDAPLRPDLSRILPRPWTRQLARDPALGSALHLPETARGEDYLVDVERRETPSPDDVGFGLSQATAVARRLAARFGRREEPTVQRPDPERVQHLVKEPHAAATPRLPQQ